MMLLWLLLGSSAQAMTLDDAWRDVEARSEEATIATEQERQAMLSASQAYTGLSPMLSAGANFTVNQREVVLDFADMIPENLLPLLGDGGTGEPTVIQKKSYFDANFTIVQPLLDARVFAGLDAAQAARTSGHAKADDARSDLRLAVARAYWAVLVAREVVGIAQSGLDVARGHADEARTVVDAGAALPQVALQAGIAVAQAERDLAAAQAQAIQADAAFAALVNHAVDTLEEPVATATPYASVDDALAEAFTHRPDLRAAEQDARLAHKQAVVSRLGWVPTLDGRFTESWTQNPSFVGEPWNWQIGLAARWTVWDGGRRLVDHAQTSSQARIADAAAARVREQVGIDVRTAWAEGERARLALVAAERARGLAEENLQLSDVSFRAGAGSFLDLEDARVALQNARVGELQERMSVHLAQMSLEHAVGTL